MRSFNMMLGAGRMSEFQAFQKLCNQKSQAKYIRNNGPVRAVLDPVYTISDAVWLAKAFDPVITPLRQMDLPSWLVHWGHPGNMAVVLFAMGFYGSGYLGWQIRTSENEEAVIKARQLHPKLAIGMFIFFALGALGGIQALILQNQPLLESKHAITGITGLLLLATQGMLSLFFDEEPGARTVHAYLGSSVLALFALHMVFGLTLGFSI
eukprot:TRINITY_DN916_c1_g2_i1.p1 TRINITY_DN916_c1_g2~~TRINITY_DN916_c1_g2_i1.p1  ORF type:complete len:209 (+),score=31.47 TRINITY_DN916_c1_g2_i1:131-757(+)